MHRTKCVVNGWATRTRWVTLLLNGLLLVLTAAASAAAERESEPRVARVSYIEGQVSYLNGDADEWTAVDVNAPLVTGDRFYSGPDGRAEIQLPGGVYARLSSNTELDLLEVSDQAVQVRVGVGTGTFRLRNVPAGQHVEISTPSTALVTRSRGVYRVDVAEDGQTTVLVREGELDAYLGDQRYRLDQGRGARIVNAAYVEGGASDAQPLEVFDAAGVQNDPWDEWERSRAVRVQSSPSYRYVGADVYGAEDLDDYGSWDRNETYGPIWRPTQVEVGWAPFTRGRWVWQDPWGWTWVDYAPWGWAPSHHGRWVYVQDSWAWAPGPVIARPIYAPATVGFLGISVNTPSVSVSVGIGPAVGWVPLGYGEPLIPWWGGFGGVRTGRPWWGGWGGPRIVNNKVIKNTDITNINVTNINYTNIDRPRGFTAVSRESFVRGDLQRVDLPKDRIRDFARPLRGAPEVIPQRESLFAARPEKLRGGRGRQPSAEVLQRAAVSTRALPASTRPAFAKKLELIERDKGAAVPPRELRRLARGTNESAPRVQTVASRGKRAVVPEVTAQAPAKPGAPLQRQARDERPDDRRETLQTERTGGERSRGTKNDEPARAALGERTMPPPQGREPAAVAGKDAETTKQGAQRATRGERSAVSRDQPAPGAAPRESAKAQRAGRGVQDAAPRGDVAEKASPGETARQKDAARGAAVRTRPQDERAADRQAPTKVAPDKRRGPAPRDDQAAAQSENAARQKRDAEQQQERQQAARQQRDAEQRRGAQVEGQQRQQAERTRRDTAVRQQRDTQQPQRAQVKRKQQPAQQREQAVRQPATRQAVGKQRQAPPPSGEEEQQASRQRRKKQQQERARTLPPGT